MQRSSEVVKRDAVLVFGKKGQAPGALSASQAMCAGGTVGCRLIAHGALSA